MTILDRIHSPHDVRRLSPDELKTLADDVRARLIDVCSRTGGHIGAGLGVVELTLALHAAFATSTRSSRRRDIAEAQIHELPQIPNAMNALDHSLGSCERGALKTLGACRTTNHKKNMIPSQAAPH